MKVLPYRQFEDIVAVKVLYSLGSPRSADLTHIPHPGPSDLIWFVRKFGIEQPDVSSVEGAFVEATLGLMDLLQAVDGTPNRINDRFGDHAEQVYAIA
jgi:hypothetical protein